MHRSPPFARRPWLALLLLSPSLALAAEKAPNQFDTVTVTATRTEQTLDQVPSTVSVQTERDIDQKNVKNIQDLVRYEPGVTVSGTGSRFGLSGFNIRGIGGNRVLTQVDGTSVPGEFAFGPFQNARRNYIDLDSVKQVEIIRGPASSLYGSDAIGGVVSFLTKDAADYLDEGDDVYARLKTGYDSSDKSWLKSSTLAGRVGQVDGVLQLSHRSGHEIKTHGGQGGIGNARGEANTQDITEENLLVKAGWNYNDTDRLQLAYERLQNDVNSDVLSEYSSFSSTPTFGIMRSNALIDRSEAKDSTDRERLSLQHRFAVDLAAVDTINWQLSYQDSEIRQRTEQTRRVWSAANAIPTPPPGTRERQRTRDSRYEEDLWSLNVQFDKRFQTENTSHTLVYGLDAKRLENSNLRKGGEIFTDTGADVPVSPTAEKLPLSDFPDPTTTQYAFFIQDSIEIGRWTLLPGLRYDHYTLKPDVTPEYLNANRQDQNPSNYSDHAISPKFGVTYDIDGIHSVYGQYAAGFKTPEAVDIYGEFSNPGHGYQYLANNSLKAENSDSYEIGLRGKYDQGSFSVALFYNRYKDFIEQVTTADPTGTGLLTYQQQNLDRTTIRGAEAKGELFLEQWGLRGFRATGAIAYARGKDHESGNPLNSVDPLKAVMGIDYTAPSSNYGAGLTWTLVAAKERIDDTQAAAARINEQFAPSGYGTLDLNGWWQVSEQFSVNGGLYNLTDKQYWQWGDVQGLDSNSVALDRFSQTGRYAAVNLVWEI